MSKSKAKPAAGKVKNPKKRQAEGTLVEYRVGTASPISLPKERASYRILKAELTRLKTRIDAVVRSGRDEEGDLEAVHRERARAAQRNLEAMINIAYCNQTLLAYRFSDE
jgi:hypothetical protein